MEPLALGALGLAMGLRIFQGGAAADIAEPSLSLAADALVFAAAAIRGARAALEGRLRLSPARLALPLGLVVLAASLSLFYAEDLYAGIRRASGWTAFAVLALLLADLAADREGARALFALVLAGAGVVLGLAWRERLWDLPRARAEYAANPALAEVPWELRADFEARLYTNQASGPFVLPNGLGAFLAIGTLAAGAAALAAPGRLAKAGFGALALAAASGILLSGQKGPWLALAAGAVVARLAKRPSRALAAGLALAGGAAIVLAALVPAERWERLPGGLSAAVRKEYAVAALRMWRERPLFGVGAGNFGMHEPRLKPAAAEETRFAHDDYLDALAEMGPIGAAALVAFWGMALSGAVRKGCPPPRPLPPAGGGGALIAGATLGILLVPVFGMRYRDWPTTAACAAGFFALALAARRAARPSALLAGAAAAFAVQSAIDFLHPEPGVAAAALACAAAAGAWPPGRVLELRRVPSRVLALALPFALFAALATFLLPRAFEADARRAAFRETGREEDIRAALAAIPFDPDLEVALADALAERARRTGEAEDRDRAIDAYRRATAGRSGLADAKARAGHLLARDAAARSAAIEWYEAAVLAYPTHPRHRFFAGEARAERFFAARAPEDRAAARRHLEAALALDKAQRTARLRLAPGERAAASALLSQL